ncbi:sigma-70 family RNA polymerase sigma factor [Fuerstiella marisgermanici]|nr:sigma-70 family RNA polymerase sigma factor [Fuerstiella marisgermanici]
MNQTNFLNHWGRYRAYLRALAIAGMKSELLPKMDPSDVVQQTLLQAVGGVDDFRGETEAERLAWLRRILARNLGHAVKHYARERRDIRREQTICATLDQSSIRMEAMLIDEATAPDERVERAEQIVELCEAVSRLPDSQRRAVELHHWQGLAISQIADEMDRSPAAVAGLLKRGLKALRTKLREE